MPLSYDFAISEAPGLDRLAHFRDPATVAALRRAPQSVRDFLGDCGFAETAYDSGAPPGAYWSTEEGTRLAIMEKMSEALERYRLPKPGEVPEGGFSLSHLFAAMMSAQPVECPVGVVPDPAAQMAAALAMTLPPDLADPAPPPPPPQELAATGRVAAGLATSGGAGGAAEAEARPPRPVRPAAAPAGPSGADPRAAPAAGDTAATAAAPRRKPPDAARGTGPGLGLDIGLAPPARDAGALPAGATRPEAGPGPAPGIAAPVRGQSGGIGRLLGLLMLAAGIVLLGYAILSLL